MVIWWQGVAYPVSDFHMQRERPEPIHSLSGMRGISRSNVSTLRLTVDGLLDVQVSEKAGTLWWARGDRWAKFDDAWIRDLTWSSSHGDADVTTEAVIVMSESAADGDLLCPFCSHRTVLRGCPGCGREFDAALAMPRQFRTSLRADAIRLRVPDELLGEEWLEVLLDRLEEDGSWKQGLLPHTWVAYRYPLKETFINDQGVEVTEAIGIFAVTYDGRGTGVELVDGSVATFPPGEKPDLVRGSFDYHGTGGQVAVNGSAYVTSEVLEWGCVDGVRSKPLEWTQDPVRDREFSTLFGSDGVM